MKFVEFLQEFTRLQIEPLQSEIRLTKDGQEKKFKQKLLDEKVTLISKFVGYFYRALSNNQKVRYQDSLQFILSKQLNLDIKLEKAHRKFSPEHKREAKENWKDIISNAKEKIDKDPEAELSFLKRKHPWSPLEQKIINKDNLQSYIEWYKNTYNEELGVEG
jgi:hypothetical protein